jgi:hypothetical protein
MYGRAFSGINFLHRMMSAKDACKLGRRGIAEDIWKDSQAVACTSQAKSTAALYNIR